MLHHYKHIILLAFTTLLCTMPLRASVVSQTDDPTNSDTYKGWVDNSLGQLVNDDITGTTWSGSGADLPVDKFIYVNDANFPDPALKSYLQNARVTAIAFGYTFVGSYQCFFVGQPTDYSSFNRGLATAAADYLLTETELNSLEKIFIANLENLTDLSGIEYFVGMTYLYIQDCPSVQTIDVSGAPHLIQLSAQDMVSLTSIDGLENLVDLDAVHIVRTAVTQLDFSSNTKITWIEVKNNRLRVLNVANCEDLLMLDCSNNELTTLDVTNNVDLMKLICSNNWLTDLDLTNNTTLETQRTTYGTRIYTWASNQYFYCKNWDINYDHQVRSLKAEAAYLPVMVDGVVQRDASGKAVMQYLYYFRLPKPGEQYTEKSLADRITESNLLMGNNTISAFDYGLTSEWTGAEYYSGSHANRIVRRAGSSATIDASEIIGDILILTPTQENSTTGEASGTATYSYDVHFSGTVNSGTSDPTGTFTINWETDSKVITQLPVTEKPAAEVTGVTYHNVAGLSSDRPWQGVNIVVTRYSDGTTTTTKVIR